MHILLKLYIVFKYYNIQTFLQQIKKFYLYNFIYIKMKWHLKMLHFQYENSIDNKLTCVQQRNLLPQLKIVFWFLTAQIFTEFLQGTRFIFLLIFLYPQLQFS